MSLHPSFSTSTRQVVGVILETNSFEDVTLALHDWAQKHQFVLSTVESLLGKELVLYRGVNRQKFIRHEIKLGKLGTCVALVAETASKGQPMDSLTVELTDIVAPLAGFKPKHIRNDIGPVEDGVNFIRKVKTHLDDAHGGLPFILISPPHEGPDRAEIDAIIAESDDIDVIRVGRNTKSKIRTLGFTQFCKGHLILRIPGHTTKVLPNGAKGSGLREAIRLARASYGLRLESLLSGEVPVKAGPERRVPPPSCWSVRAALYRAWSVHHKVLELHPNSLETAAASNYYDPAWAYDALCALCKIAEKWQVGESIGGNWEQTLKSFGYDYSPRSSFSSLGKRERHYVFMHEGRPIVADAHLSRGNHGARNVIRIYLHRDEERKMLVVCHVGSHLPTGSQST